LKPATRDDTGSGTLHPEPVSDAQPMSAEEDRIVEPATAGVPDGSQAQPRRRFDPVLMAALAGAYGAFAATFRGPPDRFWERMTHTGAALGTAALVAEPELRSTRIRVRDVVLGVASAAGLYRVFQVGDRAARAIMPSGAEDIDEIYALRSLRPRGEIASRLAFVIGPAEELFWRGLVQRRMQRRFGRWRGPPRRRWPTAARTWSPGTPRSPAPRPPRGPTGAPWPPRACRWERSS
jgi:hypothetical protein